MSFWLVQPNPPEGGPVSKTRKAIVEEMHHQLTEFAPLASLSWTTDWEELARHRQWTNSEHPNDEENIGTVEMMVMYNGREYWRTFKFGAGTLKQDKAGMEGYVRDCVFAVIFETIRALMTPDSPVR
jgi:hypothetical protein